MEKTRKLGQTDMEITAIGYGCMGQTHAYGVVEAEEDMVALMRYAHEVGYTFFDTAECYTGVNLDGTISYNEEMVGDALRN